MSELWQESIEITEGIDPCSPEVQPFLDNFQANILKFHGRDEAYHLFLRFTTESKKKIKTWIRDYISDYVTSAAQQRDASRERRKNPKYSGGLLACFFLSAAGYEALGLSTEPFESSFRHGMKNWAKYVTYLDDGRVVSIENKDPQLEDWQEKYQGEIHAMVLLAQDCRENNPSLEDIKDEIVLSLKDIGEVFHIERGRRLFNKQGEDLEHFGYRDGISNPLFFKEEIRRKRGEYYDPSAPLELVRVKDPYAEGEDCYGSYLVFRKLKQKVRVFNQKVTDLAAHINHEPALTEAQIIGRFKDGTPLTLSDQPHGCDTNNFNYEKDNGRRCPVHAHIRKANSRDNSEKNRRRRIVRRGIPYGKPGDDEVGMLFMCYQSSIHEQFEFIQRMQIDYPAHPYADSGQDPLIGQNRTTAAKQKWPLVWNNPQAGTEAFNFRSYISLEGGEYFFAPSLHFLKNIK